jgi:hypothetical protein
VAKEQLQEIKTLNILKKIKIKELKKEGEVKDFY